MRGGGDAAKNVRAEAAQRSVSQNDLADLLGISHSAVTRRLHGDLLFKDRELVKIAMHFNMPIDELAPERKHLTSEDADAFVQGLGFSSSSHFDDVLAGRAPSALRDASMKDQSSWWWQARKAGAR